jgi:hypothetical protein
MARKMEVAATVPSGDSPMMRPLLTVALGAALLFGASLPAQGAAVTYYGAGCRDAANSTNAPVILVSGSPQLGATITVRYLGPSAQTFANQFAPALITGLSMANAPVPRLTPSMATNCTLLVQPDVAVFFMPLIGGASHLDRISYQIPNVGSLLGSSVFHQFATVALTNPTYGTPVLDFVIFSSGAQVYCGL